METPSGPSADALAARTAHDAALAAALHHSRDVGPVSGQGRRSVPFSFCVTFHDGPQLAVGEGDDCVLLGGMSSSRSPRPLPRKRTTQLKTDGGKGGWVRDPGFSPSLGRRSGSSGTLWSTLSTLCVLLPWCKFSMHQCRRWCISCRTHPLKAPTTTATTTQRQRQPLVQMTLVNIITRCRTPRLPYHHHCLRGVGGGWHGRPRRLRTFWLLRISGRDHQVERCRRVLRHVWTAGGAVGVAAAVVAAGVGRSSRCCRCSSLTIWLTFSCSLSSSSPGCARAVHRQSAGHFSCAQRGYAQCKLCRRTCLVSTSL